MAGKGFSSPLKNALSAGKGDGSVQHERSMLSRIALLDFLTVFMLVPCVLNLAGFNGYFNVPEIYFTSYRRISQFWCRLQICNMLSTVDRRESECGVH